MATNEQIAWAAGFFEGEGTFSADRPRRIDGSRRCHPKASVAQKGDNGKCLLIRFQNIVECGNIYHHSTDMWAWQTTKINEFTKLYTLFEDWLSPRRRDQYWSIMETKAHQGPDRRKKTILDKAELFEELKIDNDDLS